MVGSDPGSQRRLPCRGRLCLRRGRRRGGDRRRAACTARWGGRSAYIAVGEGVDAGWIGRRVWAFTGYGGGYAERAVATLDDVTPLPDELSMIDAVALGSAGPVAHFGLAHAHLATGESVLVRGAAGSIGIMAVQRAAALGARSIGVTSSSPGRGERLRALGADHVLDREGRGDAPAAGYDVIFDIVGGPATPDFIERLAPRGRMVLVGVVGGYPPADSAGTARFVPAVVSYATFSLNTVLVASRNEVRAAQLTAAARGEVQAVVHDVLPLTEAADAHQRIDTGEVFGRIVLTP